MQVLTGQRRLGILLALPFLLYAVMGALFGVLPHWVGDRTGYLIGFACYWLLFGLAVPAALAGKGRFANLLKDRAPLFCRQNWSAALLWLVVVGVTLVMYGEQFISAPTLLILLAIPLATINGFCEELLWRGVYVNAFPTNFWLAVIYPSIGFALWHFIPQIIYPAESRVGFVLSTLFLGLVYGFIAHRTGSAKWTALSHSLSGWFALADPLALMILSTFL